MVFGTHFTYRDIDSRDFNLVIGSFDGANDLQETGITLTSDQEIRSNGTSIDYGANYTETLQFEMTVIHENGKYFSLNEQREIIRWLTLSQKLDYLEVFNGKYEDVQYLCRVIKLQKNWANGNVVGFKITWQCDSVYQYSRIKQEKINTNESRILQIYNDSDTNYIYPNLDIHVNSVSPIHLINHDENDRETVLGSYNINDTIHMNNYNQIIKAGSDYQTIDKFNLIWFRLIHGLNNIEILGDCIMDINYREIRKVGEP